MKMPSINAVLHWRTLLLLAAIPTLVNCSRIDGAVELNNRNGAPYSFEGAKVEVFDLDRSAVLAGQKTSKGNGSAASADGAIVLQVITATIDDNALYDIEVLCPANNTSDACNVESPLHLVLSGAQLKAGGWTVTALSETIFHNIAYYVASDYSVIDVQQMLDIYAGALLASAPPAPPKNYNDVLTWNPAAPEAIKRIGLLNDISEALAQGASITDLKLLTRHWTNPEIASLSPDAIGLEPTGITIVDGYAYLSGRGTSFGILDVRNPDQPVPIAIAEDIEATGPVFISGNTAFVQDFSSRIRAVDISNPQQPTLIGNVPITGRLRQVAENHAYVTTASAVQIFNISNPQQPTLTAQIAVPNAGNMAISANQLYFIANQTLHIFDISNVATPVAQGSVQIPNASSSSSYGNSQIKISAGYAYVSTLVSFRAPRLAVVDVSNPAAPTLASELILPSPRNPAPIEHMAISQTKIYLSSSEVLLEVDITDPTTPVLTQRVDYTGDTYYSRSLALWNGLAFTLSLDTGLFIYDPSAATPSAVLSGSVANPGAGTAPFALAGNYAYLSTKGVDIDVFDLTNPVAPVQNVAPFRHPVTAIAAGGSHAFTADEDNGLIHVADISNPLQPVEMPGSTIELSDGIMLTGLKQLALTGNTLFASWRSALDIGFGDESVPQMGCDYSEYGGGIFEIDVSAPAVPVITNHICFSSLVTAMAVDSTRAYAVSFVTDPVGSWLSLIDHSGDGLEHGYGVMLGGDTDFVTVNGDHVWAAEGDNGIEVVDVGNPAAPAVVASINTPGNARHIAFDERYAYVADSTAGVLIFDIANPAMPVLTASISTRGNAYYTFLAGGYLYSGTSYGLEVSRVIPQ